tara:strand:- start:14567 stop:14980 length:414 start_codon:yes stop_codon:yes gene_type:complete
MSYIDHLEKIASQDAKVLRDKDREYGGSWLKRGGVGAFMMLARKWDRLEQAMSKEIPAVSLSSGHITKPIGTYDIIERALADGREEGILDDIGDLRRYLLLVESEVRERLEAKRGAENKLPPADPFDGIVTLRGDQF